MHRDTSRDGANEGSIPVLWTLLTFSPLKVKNSYYNKASQAMQSPRTVPFFVLISLLDGYSFADVHGKGIVAFEHLKNDNKKCDLDINHRPLKHEPVKDMFILSICMKLY